MAGGVCGKDARYKFSLLQGDTHGQRSDAVLTSVRQLTSTADLGAIFAT